MLGTYVFNYRANFLDLGNSVCLSRGVLMRGAVRSEHYQLLARRFVLENCPRNDSAIDQTRSLFNIGITAVDQLEFVRMVTEKFYRRGVAKVWFNWLDMPLEKLHHLHQSEDKLGTLEQWEIEKMRWQAEKLPARLWLDSDDPDGMNGIDQGKRARAQMKKFPLIKPFRDAMENRHQWCIAAVPGKEWAQKVFPELPAAPELPA